MPDISTLTGLLPVEQLDLENYVVNAPKATFSLPKRGVYTLQAPTDFPTEAFTVSKKGALGVQIDPTIVSGENEGLTVRYVRIYSTPFRRKNGDGTETTVSAIGDYLKACGVTGVFKTVQDIADAIEQTAGRIYQAELDWKAYNQSAGIDVEGMVNFPKLPDGTFQSYFNHPTEKREDGTPKRVFANLYIRNFLSA